jgi:predicted dehydrogenase
VSASLPVGLIGFGAIGRIRAAAVQRNPNAYVAAVYDVRAPQSSYPIVNSVEEVLARVQAVFIATPNAATAPLAIKALDAGKHVFCEKPPGRSVTEATAIANAITRHPSLKVKFGFNHRYHDAILECMRLIDTGALGQVVFARGIYGKAVIQRDSAEWRNDPASAGGGILLDQGIHMVDLLRLICGDFDEVKSFVVSQRPEPGMEDNAFALFRTSGRAVAMLHSSATHWRHTFLLEVFLTAGSLTVDGIVSNSRMYRSTRSSGLETLIVCSRGGHSSMLGAAREWTVHYEDDQSWQREVDDFLECIILDQPVRTG